MSLYAFYIIAPQLFFPGSRHAPVLFAKSAYYRCYFPPSVSKPTLNYRYFQLTKSPSYYFHEAYAVLMTSIAFVVYAKYGSFFVFFVSIVNLRSALPLSFVYSAAVAASAFFSTVKYRMASYAPLSMCPLHAHILCVICAPHNLFLMAVVSFHIIAPSEVSCGFCRYFRLFRQPPLGTSAQIPYIPSSGCSYYGIVLPLLPYAILYGCHQSSIYACLFFSFLRFFPPHPTRFPSKYPLYA